MPTINARDTQAQFEAPIGQVITVNLRTDLRPDALSPDYTTAFTYGPSDIGDFSNGAVVTVWRARAVQAGSITSVNLSKANGGSFGAESTLFSYNHTISGSLRELDLAFSDDARPVVSAELVGASSSVFLYWFNPFSLAFEFRRFVESGSCPRLILDNPQGVGLTDVLMFYVSGTATDRVFYRQQRDQYNQVYTVNVGSPPTSSQELFLEDVVKLDNSRVGVYYSRRTPDNARWEMFRADTVLYPFYNQEDQFYANATIVSGALLPLLIYNATGSLHEDGISCVNSFAWQSQSLRDTLRYYYATGSLAYDGIDCRNSFTWLSQSVITVVLVNELTDTFTPPIVTLLTGSLEPTLLSKDYSSDVFNSIAISLVTSSLI